jgi:hypothetical protein
MDLKQIRDSVDKGYYWVLTEADDSEPAPTKLSVAYPIKCSTNLLRTNVVWFVTYTHVKCLRRPGVPCSRPAWPSRNWRSHSLAQVWSYSKKRRGSHEALMAIQCLAAVRCENWVQNGEPVRLVVWPHLNICGQVWCLLVILVQHSAQ